MQLDRLTIKAQEALQGAQQIAHRNSNQEVDGEHLLTALLEQSESLVSPLLEKIGVPLARLSAELKAQLERKVKVQGTASVDVFLSPALKQTLDAAADAAAKLRDEYISTEHLLLGLIERGGSELKAIFKANKKMSYADCFGAALAIALQQLPRPRKRGFITHAGKNVE